MLVSGYVGWALREPQLQQAAGLAIRAEELDHGGRRRYRNCGQGTHASGARIMMIVCHFTILPFGNAYLIVATEPNNGLRVLPEPKRMRRAFARHIAHCKKIGL
jgi:hypothetical protein